MSTSSLKVLLAGMNTEHDTPHSTCYAGRYRTVRPTPGYHTVLDQKYRLAIDWTCSNRTAFVTLRVDFTFRPIDTGGMTYSTCVRGTVCSKPLSQRSAKAVS